MILTCFFLDFLIYVLNLNYYIRVFRYKEKLFVVESTKEADIEKKYL